MSEMNVFHRKRRGGGWLVYNSENSELLGYCVLSHDRRAWFSYVHYEGVRWCRLIQHSYARHQSTRDILDWHQRGRSSLALEFRDDDEETT
jgi:hypothetical protein